MPDSSKVRIQRVQHDHPALLSLHKITLPGDRKPAWSRGWWWLASINGQDVGFAGMQPSARWGDAAYLCRCGVIPSARGAGLQKRLIATRERWARKIGMRWLISDTYLNTASANSLIGSGFKLYEPSAPWGVARTLYWRKAI